MMIGKGMPISHNKMPLPQVTVHLPQIALVAGLTVGVAYSSIEWGGHSSTMGKRGGLTELARLCTQLEQPRFCLLPCYASRFFGLRHKTPPKTRMAARSAMDAKPVN
jgi:hypothetical protein